MKATRSVWSPGVVLLVLLALVVAALAGWRVSAEANDRDRPSAPVNSAEVVAEYDAVSTAFELDYPADVQLPVLAEAIEGFGVRADGSPILREDDEPVLIDIWRCGWERSYLQARRTDFSAGSQRAADQLMRHDQLPLMKKWDGDPARAWQTQVRDAGLSGDLEAFEGHLRARCAAR